MTSTQSMQTHRESGALTTVLARRMLLALLLALVAGCGPKLVAPMTLHRPGADDQLWGVAPFLNESGVSDVDTAKIADAFMVEAQQAHGIDTVPVNRVIFAMREHRIDAVTSHAAALTIMNQLGLDGLVVGTVTAYDPYRPMTLGLATQLYVRPRVSTDLDPRALTRSTSGHVSPGEIGPRHPVAVAAGVFNANNHMTRCELEAYATGRTDPESAFVGADRYLMSMDLYTRFVCYRLLRDLLENEAAAAETVAMETR